MNGIITNQATMSSREIAELIEKQHSHIKVSAERLAEKGVIGTLATREFTHNGNKYTEYLLNKRDSMVLVAQNCPEFTARIVDRWQELEAQVANPIATAIAELTRMDILKLAMDSEHARLAAETKLAQAAPMIEGFERIANSDGSFCLTDAAKTLQVQPRKFTQFLLEQQWVYRRPMGAGYLAYQPRIQSGELEHKVTTGNKSDGTAWTGTQVRVTAKGLAKLATMMRRMNPQQAELVVTH
jgi:phage antirepressor YoqD-like protein